MTRNLIGVRRQEEAIEEHSLAARECWPDLARHQLRTRRHEQQRFRAWIDVRRRIEQQAPNLGAQWRSARLAHGEVRDVALRQLRREATQLGRLPRALAAFEHDQPTTADLRHSTLAECDDGALRAFLDAVDDPV